MKSRIIFLKCKIKVQTQFYSNNIQKHEHEHDKNKTMMEDKIIRQIDVEKTKSNEGSYLYFIPI